MDEETPIDTEELSRVYGIDERHFTPQEPADIERLALASVYGVNPQYFELNQDEGATDGNTDTE